MDLPLAEAPESALPLRPIALSQPMTGESLPLPAGDNDAPWSSDIRFFKGCHFGGKSNMLSDTLLLRRRALVDRGEGSLCSPPSRAPPGEPSAPISTLTARPLVEVLAFLELSSGK